MKRFKNGKMYESSTLLPEGRTWQMFPVEGHRVSISGSAGFTVPVVATPFCWCSRKVATHSHKQASTADFQ